MSFDEWFEEFSKNKDLTNMSIKDIAKTAYKQGAIDFEKEMPMYVHSETGEISQVPREDNESLFPEGEKWSDEDVDLESWLKEKKKTNENK